MRLHQNLTKLNSLYNYPSFSCFFMKKIHEVFSFKIFCKQVDSSRTTSVFSTTAAVAEAVCIIHDQRLVLTLNPSGIVGPAARQFLCILCVLWLKICVIWVFCGFLNYVYEN